MAQEPLVIEQRALASPDGMAVRHLVRALVRRKLGLAGAAILLAVLALAVAAPVITPETPYDPATWDVTNQGLSPRLSPAWYFLLGTDLDGHLLLSQLAWGGRITLGAGLTGGLGAALIGTLVGALAGYAGDWLDTLLMRVTDVFLALPYLPLVLFAAQLFGAHDAWATARILAVFSWPAVARHTRAIYAGLRAQAYAEAARAVGVGPWRIIIRHLLPNALGQIIVACTLAAATCLTIQVTIDYFGLGTRYPDVSWGATLSAALTMLGSPYWWLPVFPGLLLVLTILAVYIVGASLEQALDRREAE